MNIKYENRLFQLWEYRVSHSNMLIRSPKAPGVDTNIDLIFGAVEYVDLPNNFESLSLGEPNEEDEIFIYNRLGKKINKKNIHVLISNSKRFRIVATFFRIDENDLDIFSSPFIFPRS